MGTLALEIAWGSSKSEETGGRSGLILLQAENTKIKTQIGMSFFENMSEYMVRL